MPALDAAEKHSTPSPNGADGDVHSGCANFQGVGDAGGEQSMQLMMEDDVPPMLSPQAANMPSSNEPPTTSNMAAGNTINPSNDINELEPYKNDGVKVCTTEANTKSKKSEEMLFTTNNVSASLLEFGTDGTDTNSMISSKRRTSNQMREDQGKDSAHRTENVRISLINAFRVLERNI